jgi:tetratricopeptide (TPR) repeat protein
MANQNPVEDPLKSAQLLYDEHNYSEAVNAYQKILDSGGVTADAYGGLADSLSCLWRYEDAVVAYNESIRIDSTQPETYYGLGEALYGLRRFPEAIKNYQKAADIHLTQASEAHTKYYNLIGLGNFSAAEQEDLLARRADEKFSDRCNDLGFAYLCIREYDEAIAKLGLAIDNGKQYPYAYHTLASVFWTQGNYKNAMTEWKKARKLYVKCLEQAKQNDWIGHFLYFGNLLHEVFGELDKAEEIFRQGLEIEENHLKTWIALVALYLERMEDNPKQRNKAYWDAQRAYKKAKTLIAGVLKNSADVENLVLAGELALTMKEYEEAETLLKEALKKDEETNDDGPYVKSAKPKTDLGILCMRRKQFKEAIEYFEAATKIDPDDLSLRSNLAEAYLRDDQLDDAEREFQRTLASAPDHIESKIGLGGVYVALGETGDPDMYDPAIVQYTEAIGLAMRRAGSKRLKKKELASVFYSRGYARVKSYEASKTPKDRGRLFDARDDFRTCFKNDADQYKAKRAVEKIDKVLPPRSPQRFMEEWGPPVIFLFSVAVFVLSQIIFVWSFLDKSKIPFSVGFLDQAQHLPLSDYVALTFGSLILMVASSYLPQLLKLKVPGIELEKTAVDQVTTLGPVGISKAS